MHIAGRKALAGVLSVMMSLSCFTLQGGIPVEAEDGGTSSSDVQKEVTQEPVLVSKIDSASVTAMDRAGNVLAQFDPIIFGDDDGIITLADLAQSIDGYSYSHAQINGMDAQQLEQKTEANEEGALRFHYYAVTDGAETELTDSLSVTLFYDQNPEVQPQVQEQAVTTLSTDTNDGLATVTASGNIPDGTELHADVLSQEQLNQALASISATLQTDDILYGIGYDIYFMNNNGQRFEPDGSTAVSIQYKEPSDMGMPEGSDITMQGEAHLKDDGQVDVYQNALSMDGTCVTSASFMTETFSPFVSYVAGAASNTLPANTWKPSDTLNELTDGATSIKKLNDGEVEKDSSGAYKLSKGSYYKVNISFSETEEKQFTTNATESMTYNLPSGITAREFDNGETNVDVSIGGIVYSAVCYYSVKDRKLTITGWKNDENFRMLNSAENANIHISFYASFSDQQTVIDWGNNKKTSITLSNDGTLTASKGGSYDKNSNKLTYTVTLTSKGTSKGVSISDTLKNAYFDGTPLEISSNYVRTDLPTITPEKGSSTFTAGDSQKFDMSDGETITIKYAAIPNINGITENDQKKEIVTVKNSFKGKGENNTESGSDSKDISIDFTPTLSKNHGQPQAGEDGYVTIPWTITYNSDALISVKGNTITDTLTNTDKVPQEYSGNVTVTVKDHSGNEIRTKTITPQSDSKSWTYTIPGNDLEYSYTFDYYTKANANDLIATTDAGNTVDDNKGNSATSNASINPRDENKVSLSKEVERNDDGKTITWKISLKIPKKGLDKAVVTDIYPNTGEYIDTLNGDISIEGIDNDKERSKITKSNDKAVITFSKSVNNKWVPGLLASDKERTITIRLTTNVNQDWVKIATWQKDHKNTANLNDIITATASAIPHEPFTFKKSNENTILEPVYTDGQWRGNAVVFPYKLALNGNVPDSFFVNDTFPSYLSFKNGALYGSDENQWYQGYIAGSVNITKEKNNDDGTKTVTLHIQKTKNYSFLSVKYSLKALPDNKDFYNALKNSNGSLKFSNTASCNGNKSGADTTYVYQEVNKTSNVSNGKELNYQITLNENAACLNDGRPLTITDVFSNLAISYTSIKAAVSGSGQNSDVSWKTNGNKITFTIPDSSKVVITYKGRAIESGEQVSNTACFNGQSASDNKTLTFDEESGGTATNYYITLYKCDADNEAKGLPGATFTLYEANGDSLGKELKSFTTGSDGTVKIMGDSEKDGWTLNRYAQSQQYLYLVETAAPQGYENDQTKYRFLIGKKADYSNNIYFDGDEIRIKDRKFGVFGVHVSKSWNDGKDAANRQPVNVQLYANGNIKGEKIVLSNDNNWEYTWNNIPKNDSSGNAIKYTVKEVDTPNGYVSSVSGSMADGFVITNTKTKSITVKKKWTNDDSSNRPQNIQLQLYQGDKKYEVDPYVNAVTVTEGANGIWTYTFKNLPAYDTDGNEITYSVKEENVPNGYSVSGCATSENNYTLTNTYGIASVRISKVDVTDQHELSGAHIQVLTKDETGNDKVVEEWDSKAETEKNGHEVTGLKTGVTYTLRETVAPEGYNLTTDTTFTLDQNGQIDKDKTTTNINKEGVLLVEDRRKEEHHDDTPKQLRFRVQKRSRQAPYDPLMNTTYGLYKADTNELVEKETSDAGGNMYFTKLEEGVKYYLKEITAPTGHEVDPDAGKPFSVKFVNGIAELLDDAGNVHSTAARTEVQQTQTDLASLSAGTGEAKAEGHTDGVTAAVIGKTEEVNSLAVSVTGSAFSDAMQANVSARIGGFRSLVLYHTSFMKDAALTGGQLYIQSDVGIALNDFDSSALRLVIMNDDGTVVSPASGTLEIVNGVLKGISLPAGNYSYVGIIQPEDSTRFDGILSADSFSNVTDDVTKLDVVKTNENGQPLAGAVLQIKDLSTGRVMAEWKTDGTVKSYRRWFNENEKIALDVNTKYVLHEVSAPDGYDTAEDIVFSLNQYDSSLVFYEKVNGEWKESRMTAEYKLTMVDQKAGTHTYPHDNNHTKDHPHKPDDETKNHQTDHGTETPRPDKNKETVTKTSDSQEQPKETQSSTTVNTGVADNSAWLGLFVIAALGLAAVLLRKKRMN
jgi:LPXTG-motif cell wall-anchored protein